MATVAPNVVVTDECRLSFVNLFEAKKIKDTDKVAKYSVTAIIPKTDTKTIAAIKAAVAKAAELGAQKHFGGRVPTNVTNTFKDGDAEVDDLGELKNLRYPEYKNSYFIRLSTKDKPRVTGPDGQEILNPIDCYSGMYGKVSMSFYAYSGDGRRGVSASLGNVRKTRDGESLTTRLNGSELDD